MKKAILITIGAIAGTTSLVASGVFLPSLYVNSSPSTVKVDSNSVFISKTAQSSITVKEAIMGTNKVNNGNYVLYFGSEGIDSNFKFLYNVPKIGTNVENEKEKQLLKREKKLSGDYWNAINYVQNNAKAQEDIVQPEFIAYINLLGNGVLEGRVRVAKEATSALTEVIDVRDSFKNLSNTKKEEIINKYNFVKDKMLANAPLQTFLSGDIKTFYANLKLPYAKFDPNYKGNEKLLECVTWEVWPENIPLKTNPFDTYTTWDKKVKYYDDSAYTNEFRSLWEFIKTNPLFSKRTPKDINENNGFILGYRDGKLTNFYDDSFNAEQTEDTETGGSENSKPETPPSSFSINNLTNNEDDTAPLPSAKNTFFSWISNAYSKKKN